MILVELTAAVDEAGSLRTFYVGTVGFQTAPTDSPADVAFDETVIDAGSIGLHAFSDGRTGGATRLETGEIRIANGGGEYDAWINYSFDGRPVVIRVGEGGAYPAAFETLFSGVAESVQVTASQVVVRLMDKAALLDVPVLTTTYAGTNSGATGIEGTADDLKGRVKPRVYGAPREVGPPCANTSKLVYQVSDGALAAIEGVYDRGLALAFGADHADLAALNAATIAAGDYDTCLAQGLFRLGGTPSGQITCDPVERDADHHMTAGEVIARLASAAGLTEAEVSAADIGELNAAAPYVVGLYLEDATTFRAALDLVAGSVGAWWGFDGEGVLRCGQLGEPAGEAAADLFEGEVLISGFGRGTFDGGVPVWRVTVRHTRFWTPQASDIAGAVTDQRRAELAQAWRAVTAEAPEVKIQFKLARELVVETLLTSAADAQAEADRLLALHRVRRDRFDAPVGAGMFDQVNVPLMATLALTHSRFGLSAGRNLVVLGRTLELGADRIILHLWG